MPRDKKLRGLAASATISAVLLASTAARAATPSEQCRFLSFREWNNFAVVTNNGAEKILISPVIQAPMAWDQLIVSWNGSFPTNSSLKVEARGIYPDHQTKFYSLAFWSPGNTNQPSEGGHRQRDADGEVKTDTLVLKRPGANVELRLVLTAMNDGALPEIKFLGLSFLDSRVQVEPLSPDHEVWGKIIDTPERSQHGYPNESGWCSPTSLSMVLARWAGVLGRPEMNLDVPTIASDIYDPVFGGTGNWVFNMAFAGGFPGMRAYVARLSDLAEVEEWIGAGIPVVLSAPWHLLAPGRGDTGSGHLVVCIGFTEDGDVVINDPATNLQKGQKVRHIYKRDAVVNAWKKSHNTVYLIYPESAKVPPDRFGHWAPNEPR